MNNMPVKLRKELSLDPFYLSCARAGLHGHSCAGRTTREHALIHAGRQIQAKFAIVPLCAKAHGVDEFQDGGDLDKHANEWIALNRASDDELRAISKAKDYFRYRDWLNTVYGEYREPLMSPSGINYGYHRHALA